MVSDVVSSGCREIPQNDDWDPTFADFFDIDAYDSTWKFFVLPSSCAFLLEKECSLQNSLAAREVLDLLSSLIPSMPHGRPSIDLAKAFGIPVTGFRTEFFLLLIYLFSNKLIQSLPLSAQDRFAAIIHRVFESHQNRKILVRLISHDCPTVKSFTEALLPFSLSQRNDSLAELILKTRVIREADWWSFLLNNNALLYCPNAAKLMLNTLHPIEALYMIKYQLKVKYDSALAESVVRRRTDQHKNVQFWHEILLAAIMEKDTHVVSLILTLRLNPESVWDAEVKHVRIFTILAAYGCLSTLQLFTQQISTLSVEQAKKKLGAALPVAALNDRPRHVKWLLSLGADIDHIGSAFFACFDSSCTALQAAAVQNNTAMSLFLLSKGAGVNLGDVNATKTSAMATPLHAAAYHGNLVLVREFLVAGASIHISCVNKIISMRTISGERFTGSLLDAAASSGNIDVVKCILKAVASTKEALGNESKALGFACSSGNPDVVRLLLEIGLQSQNSLQIAATAESWEIVKDLLAHDQGGGLQKAFQSAIQRYNTEVASGILAYHDQNANHNIQTDLNPLLDKNRFKPRLLAWGDIYYALKTSVRSTDIEMIELLLSYSRNNTVFVQQCSMPDTGRELLKYVLSGSWYARKEPRVLSMFRLLCREWGFSSFPTTAKFDPPQVGGEGTLLQRAIDEGFFELAKAMVQMGVYVNSSVEGLKNNVYKEPFGLYTALQAAAKRSADDLVDSLLNAGADVNAVPADYKGATALQCAAFANSPSIVRKLLDAGALVNAEAANYRGATALQYAATHGNFAIVEALLGAGANVNAPPAKVSGFTALEAAALNGRLDMVRFLLNSGADIAGPTSPQYRRAVGFAWRAGHFALAEYLQRYKEKKYGTEYCETLKEICGAPDVTRWNDDKFWTKYWGIRNPWDPEYEFEGESYGESDQRDNS